LALQQSLSRADGEVSAHARKVRSAQHLIDSCHLVQHPEPVRYLLPDTSAAERVIVKEGMRLVIHPNFSVPNVGWFSVGDNVLVTANGVERLGQYPRECFEA